MDRRDRYLVNEERRRTIILRSRCPLWMRRPNTLSARILEHEPIFSQLAISYYSRRGASKGYVSLRR